jgi:hypothetical protein
MFRRITYVAVLGACILAALSLAGSAMAAPTAPQLSPLPFYVSDDQPVSWSPSVLDPDGLPGLSSYEFQLVDMTAGGASTKTYRPYTLPATEKLNMLFPNVVELHEYFLCVRTVEVTAAYEVRFSYRTCAHFKVTYSIKDLWRIVNQYIEVNPDPGCIVCGPDEILTKDPEILTKISAGLRRDPAPITGLRVDARGGVAIVTG